jgi:hypothetical protein
MDKQLSEAKAKQFQELKPVYVLAVVNGMFSKSKNWYHHLQIVDIKDTTLIIDGLDYILLELPNFTPDKWTNEYKRLAISWMRFLREAESYTDHVPEEISSDKHIRKALSICEASALTPAERDAYDQAEYAMIWQNSIRGLEDEVIEARKTIEENKKTIEDKDKTIEESKKTIEDKDKENEKLKNELEKLKRQMEKNEDKSS